MTRSVMIVLLLAGVLIGLGVALSDRIFGDAPSSTVVVGPPAPAPAPAAAPPATPPPAGDGTAVAAVVPPEAVLVSLRGRVQTRRGEGTWDEATADAVLGADDSVRTGRNAEATVRLGNGVEVRLSPRSELRVRELSEAVSKVRLDEGHVVASVGVGGRTLRVQAKGSDAEAESRGGTFGVVTDGRGQLAVAATTGVVKVSAAGSAVEVGAGQTTSVEAGKAPSAPTEVPSSLYLKLGALAATQTNQTSTTVAGTTSPGALVRIGDQVATSDARGRFAMRVPLRDGKNELAVEVVDASGRREDQRLPAVMVDREKPKIDAAVQWGRPN
jgi:hypothetical protein